MSSEFQTVINSVGDLPSMPAVSVKVKVIQLLQDPATSATGLAAAISHDIAVSARVLNLANSKKNWKRR